MAKITLEKVSGTSKKGKQYTAYRFKAGLYQSPLFFPDPVNEAYLQKFISDSAHEEFKNGTKDDEPLDDLDD